MSNTNYVSGEVSWGDTKLFDGKNAGKKDEWLRLMPGTNQIRVLTLPHQYYQHQIKLEFGNKYGYRVNCSTTKDSGCPICESGDKPKRRWLLGVIDRKTGLWKILDVGFGIFKEIKKFNDDVEDWGDPTTFDIVINCDPNGGPQRYSCVPKPKRPLSATDLALQAEHGVDTLVFRTTPPTYEKVQERIARIKEDIAKSNGGEGSNASSQSLNDDNEEDSDSEFFQDYDKVKKTA
jgi:hypothetical protein